MDIKNKVALITGGASGLGFASAQKLIAAGAKIMVMDLNEDNAKKACSELDGETDYAVANVAEFRGTPLLVQIFIIYFGLGQIEYLRTTFLWIILK